VTDENDPEGFKRHMLLLMLPFVTFPSPTGRSFLLLPRKGFTHFEASDRTTSLKSAFFVRLARSSPISDGLFFVLNGQLPMMLSS